MGDVPLSVGLVFYGVSVLIVAPVVVAVFALLNWLVPLDIDLRSLLGVSLEWSLALALIPFLLFTTDIRGV